MIGEHFPKVSPPSRQRLKSYNAKFVMDKCARNKYGATLIADMIYIITEQCMDIEWARCKDLLISRLLNGPHKLQTWTLNNTEQCMGIEWARCKELQIPRLLDDLHRYKIGGLIRDI